MVAFDGSIAQYLGDGLLVYFGYPVAHEDDAIQAVGLVCAALRRCALHPRSGRLPSRSGCGSGFIPAR